MLQTPIRWCYLAWLVASCWFRQGSANAASDSELDKFFPLGDSGGTTVPGLWSRYVPLLPTAIRLNAGATSSYTDNLHQVWLPDMYFFGGSRNRQDSQAVKGVEDDTIYQSRRFGNSFQYQLPVGPGVYLIRLHFAEIYSLADANFHVFDVSAEGYRLLASLDVVHYFGFATATAFTIPIHVQEPDLTLSFAAVTGGDAFVSAVEVFNASSLVNISPPTSTPATKQDEVLLFCLELCRFTFADLSDQNEEELACVVGCVIGTTTDDCDNACAAFTPAGSPLSQACVDGCLAGSAFVDPCSSNPCANGGTCEKVLDEYSINGTESGSGSGDFPFEPGVLTYQCTCPSPFAGPQCLQALTTTTTAALITTEGSTTGAVATTEATTEDATTEVVTTEGSTTEVATTEGLTTEVVTTEDATTEVVSTTEGSTTEVATTEGLTTEVATTEGSTTEVVTTEDATTEVVSTTEDSTTEVATTEGSTTEVATTEGSTTEVVVTTEDPTSVITTKGSTTEVTTAAVTTEPTSTSSTIPLIEPEMAMPIFEVDPGFLVDSVRQVAGLPFFQQQFGQWQGARPRAQGELIARIGNKSSALDFQLKLQPAMFLTAVLVSPERVFLEEPFVRVRLQALDAAYNMLTLATPVQIQLQLPQGVLQASCFTAPETGACIATLGIPAESFSVEGVAQTAELSFAFSGNTADWHILASVNLFPQPAPKPSDGVYVIIPQRSLVTKEVFFTQVYGYGAAPISSFIMAFEVELGAQMLALNFDPSKWDVFYLSDALPGRTLVLIANVLSSAVAAESKPELLFNVTMAMDSTEVPPTVKLSSTVHFISDINGNDMGRNTPFGAMIYGRESALNSANLLTGVENIISLLVQPSQTELLNTAVLTGVAQYFPVVVRALSDRGRELSLVAMTCVSSDDSRLQVTGNCSHVFFSGSEQAGAHQVNVTVSSPGLQSILVSFRVWYPDMASLEIALSDTFLQPIANASHPVSCQQLYQRAAVSIGGRFATDQPDNNFSVQLTSVLALHLSTADVSVADLDLSDVHAPMLVGQAEGLTDVSLHIHTIGLNPLVSVPVRVGGTADFVKVRGLSALAVQDIVFEQTLLDDTVFGRYDTATQTARLSSLQTREGQRAFVAIAALFSDETVLPLRKNQGNLIYIETDFPSRMSVEQGELVALGDFTGEAGRVQWINNPNCGLFGSEVIGETLLMTEIVLTKPVAVFVEAETVLAIPGDSATLPPVNMRTFSFVRVVVDFGTHSKDLTLDPRTSYTVADGSVLQIETLLSQVLVSPSSSESGRAILMVSFAHLSLVKNVSFDVVRTEHLELAVRPFPKYPGSTLVTKTVLHPIASSGFWQTAVINVFLRLSNDELKDISSGSIQFSFRNVTTDLADSSIAEVDAVNMLYILRRVTDGRFGMVALSAVFDKVSTIAPVNITVTDTPIQVTSINNLSIPTTVAVQAQVQLGLTFEDDTQFTLLFEAGLPVLPNLVQLNISDNTIASVDSTTGLVHVQQNSPGMLELTATAGAVTANIFFASNKVPGFLDVDIGAETGVAVPPATLGSTFSVPVRLNVGENNKLGVLKLSVFFDSDMLQAESVTAGADWSGTLRTTLDDPRGSVTFGGLPADIPGPLLEVVIITFRVTAGSPAVTVITGVVTTVGNEQARLIGDGGGGRSFVAGFVPMALVLAEDGRRDYHPQPYTSAAQLEKVLQPTLFDQNSAAHQVRRLTPVECSVLPLGDTNADCVLDLLDVKFLQLSIVQTVLDPTYFSSLRPEQVDNMDVDKNGVVNADDKEYLERVIFKFYPFLKDLSVQPVDTSSSRCTLQITVSLVLADGSPAIPNQTAVFFDLESSDPDFFSAVRQTIFKQGTLAQDSKGPGYQGVVWKGAFIEGEKFGVEVATKLSSAQNIGVSLVLATTNQNGVTSAMRVTPMLRGSPQRDFSGRFMFNTPFNYNLPITSDFNSTLVGEGYNPRLLFDNSDTTEFCELAKPSRDDEDTSVNLLPIVLPIFVLIVLLLSVIILIVVRRKAKDGADFYVRVQRKANPDWTQNDHPLLNEGCPFGYAIRVGLKGEFVLGRELHLVKGRTYRFRMLDVSKDYPFYISASDFGGGNGIQEFLSGVEGNPAMGNDMLCFTPPPDVPSLLWYQCTKQKCMGYKIHVEAGEVAVEVTAPYVSFPLAPKEQKQHPPPVYRSPPSYTSAQFALQAKTLHQTTCVQQESSTFGDLSSVQTGPQTRSAPSYVPPPSYLGALKCTTFKVETSDAIAWPTHVPRPGNRRAHQPPEHNAGDPALHTSVPRPAPGAKPQPSHAVASRPTLVRNKDNEIQHTTFGLEHPVDQRPLEPLPDYDLALEIQAHNIDNPMPRMKPEPGQSSARPISNAFDNARQDKERREQEQMFRAAVGFPQPVIADPRHVKGTHTPKESLV